MDTPSDMPDMERHSRQLLQASEWLSPGRAPFAFRALAALSVIGLIVAANVVFLTPLRDRAEILLLRVQSEIKGRLPHAQYLPTPVAEAAWPAPNTLPASVPSARPSPTATAPPPQTPQPAGIARPPARTGAVKPTATPTPTPTATLVPTATPLPAAAQIESSYHEPQGWNNCGPATLAMALHPLGFEQDQYAIAAVLKPDKNDKNVGPEEMVDYAHASGDAFAVLGYGTDIRVLKLLLSNGYPVIVETWFIPEPGDEMGHYRLLTGYDDAAGEFTAQDAYYGPDQAIGYDSLDGLWRVFNRVYVVVTAPERAGALRALLGDRIDPERMHAAALDTALAEIAADPDDRYAWFNAGTNYLALGRPTEAAAAYDRARRLQLPWRVMWYQFGPFEAYLQVRRYGDVIALAEANLKTARNLEESYYYRAMARRALGDATGAQADLQVALRYNPNYTRAAEAQGEQVDGHRTAGK